LTHLPVTLGVSLPQHIRDLFIKFRILTSHASRFAALADRRSSVRQNVATSRTHLTNGAMPGTGVLARAKSAA
jgi:hypothetical protein